MSERTHRRRRRRRRGRDRPVSSESPPIDADSVGADSADEDAQAGASGRHDRVESRRGASAAPRPAPPKTIMGMPRLMFGIMVGMLLAVLSVTVLSTIISPPAEDNDLQGALRLPDQGRRHLAEGETFTNYNSSPPTSGPQDPIGVTPGTYGPDEAAPFDQLPSFSALLPVLEQGGIVIYFDPDALATEETEQLRHFVDAARRVRPNLVLTPISPLTMRILITDNPDADDASEIEVPIVATAWRHLLPLEERQDEENGFQTTLETLGGFLAIDPDGYYERFVLDREGRAATLRALNTIADR